VGQWALGLSAACASWLGFMGAFMHVSPYGMNRYHPHNEINNSPKYQQITE
jgi:hypothetical protein